MASLEYFNRQVALVDIFYDSHSDLIDKICGELGHSEKSEELKKKYLDRPLKLKAKKDPNQPKKPKSSYLLFSDQFRKSNIETFHKKSVKETAKIIGSAWKALSQEEREVYENLSVEEKGRYKKEWEEYQQLLFNQSLY
jgi:DNA mismatch repair ATPase MutS